MAEIGHSTNLDSFFSFQNEKHPLKAMQSRFITSIKKSVSDKNYWLLVLISAGAGILTYLIATAVWFIISGVNWLEFPVISLFCIVPFVLGTMIAAPFINTKKASAFLWLYMAIAISFIVFELINTNLSDPSTSAWNMVFIFGWCIITILPVYFLYYFANKLL
ncbi:MAG: hypothetical protein J5543_04015 [Bacteroidales bacterium]|nr:hypothetical protein [Bacteroidales bacterium]